MSQSKSIVQKTDTSRLLKDKLAKYGVMVGGIMVLCALLLLFFYLLYIVAPVFQSAGIENKHKISTQSDHYVALGLEEQNDILYAIHPSGLVDFYATKTAKHLAQNQISLKGDHQLFARSPTPQSLYAFINENAQVTVIKPFFKVDFVAGRRIQTPSISYPYGEAPIQLQYGTDTEITKLSLAQEDQSLGLLYVDQDQQLYFDKINTASSLFGEQQNKHLSIHLNKGMPLQDKVNYAFISPDLSRAFVLTSSRGYVFNLRNMQQAHLLYEFDLAIPEGVHLTSANLHSGANSLLLGFDNGHIEQWFETIQAVGRDFVKVRSFEFESNLGENAISQIVPELYRRSFIATNDLGEINLFHTTAESQLWQGELSKQQLQGIAFSPRSDAIVYHQGQDILIAEVDNEHPEVTWSGLWQQVWYEGYPEPGYIWQSSSASDDFEPKFSLVPITFGTIKAALYAMLFAVPIGLAAAIYTAYFMAPKARQIVKPTVEIMEALPTVILGFLAGLWLAPLVEERLPGFVMGLVLLPIGILITALSWRSMPERIKDKVPDGWEPMLLLPVIAVIVALSYFVSPLLEAWLFNGDTRQFITNDLGISFDQRNSLVVGIAMGFAVIPTVFSIAEDAVFSVPKTLSNGSLALGATQWQTLTKVVLLTASPGIFSAVMMGLGRAVGETMIVLMATGNTPIMDWSVFQGMRTLSANIAVEMPESEVGSSHYRILFLAAFVLFIFTFVFNTIAEFVRQRLREKYSSL